MSEGADHFLTSLYVHNAFAVRDLEIPIAKDGEQRHLLLTGPNGSGKSTILHALYEELSLRLYGMGQRDRVAHVQSLPFVEVKGTEFDEGSKRLLVLMHADRSLSVNTPSGPNKINERDYLRGTGDVAKLLLQYLVNLRTEQALAREDGEDDVADRIANRLGNFESRFRLVLDDEDAELHFERSKWNYTIQLGDDRIIEFGQLPDGVSNILFLWANLMIPLAGDGSGRGWALIDEPELHLHARLQEMVLPFLTGMFPNVQFIVATHSPAVLASIPDATIYDLGSRKTIDSSDLQGIRYGTILTEHFGIETDFDLETTRKLRRLKALSDAEPNPGTPEFEALQALAQELSEVPHLLVAQVSKKLDVA